jgi:membrane protein YdbS with pleckstrin-like domain
MPESQSSPPQNPKEPIAARTFNLTRVTGLAGVIAAVATGLSTALGAFEGEPVAVIVAALAVIAVAMVVTGHVFTTDMRVRNRQAIADNYIR